MLFLSALYLVYLQTDDVASGLASERGIEEGGQQLETKTSKEGSEEPAQLLLRPSGPALKLFLCKESWEAGG